MALGLSAAKDDDGNAASAPQAADTVTPKQVEALRDALKATPLTEADFLAQAGQKAFEDIHANRFDAAMSYLKRQAKGDDK